MPPMNEKCLFYLIAAALENTMTAEKIRFIAITPIATSAEFDPKACSTRALSNIAPVAPKLNIVRSCAVSTRTSHPAKLGETAALKITNAAPKKAVSRYVQVGTSPFCAGVYHSPTGITDSLPVGLRLSGATVAPIRLLIDRAGRRPARQFTCEYTHTA